MTAAKKVPNVDGWLEQARALRADMYESEAKFFLFLVAGETGGVPWQDAGFSSFEELINEGGLCTVSRYVSFRNALTRVDPSQAETIGVDGVIQAAKVMDEVKRAKVVATLDEARARKGHPVSGREAQRIAQQIDPHEREPMDLRRARARSQTEEECVALRKARWRAGTRKRRATEAGRFVGRQTEEVMPAASIHRCSRPRRGVIAHPEGEARKRTRPNGSPVEHLRS